MKALAITTMRCCAASWIRSGSNTNSTRPRNFTRAGQFDEVLKRAVEKYDEVMEVMLKSLREERRQTYSIFLPIHPETGRVLYVPMKKVCAETHTITFDDEEGREWTLPVTGGQREAAMEAGFRCPLGGAGMWISKCMARTTAPTRRFMTKSAAFWAGLRAGAFHL